MVQLAVWCSLRVGELAELRRGDVDLKRAVLHVRSGVAHTSSGRVVKTPKSEAGIAVIDRIPGCSTWRRTQARAGRCGVTAVAGRALG
jgi:hypothetical protein